MSSRPETSSPQSLSWFKDKPSPLRLHCAIQHYDWGEKGSSAYIPRLLGLNPEEGKPYAELWIGAHPLKPSLAGPADDSGSREAVPLDRLVAACPEEILGQGPARRFQGKLPFLMKVLAAGNALSIQAHPDKKQAEEGFAREDARGIARDDARRNYKDDNHKPEVIVALTDFYALNKFRPLGEIADLLRTVPEWGRLAPAFEADLKSCGKDPVREKELLKNLYKNVMEMEQEAVNRVFDPLLERLESENRRNPFSRESREYWLLKADRTYSQKGKRDRGLFSLYLLNLVHLKPGQGSYLDAGELHAYLEGVGVEVMANSDNVLRGGLTPKHVDIPELLKTLTFNSGAAKPLSPDARGLYATPAAEFEVRVLSLAERNGFRRDALYSAEILLVTEGSVRITTPKSSGRIGKGGILLVPAVLGSYALEAESGPAVVYSSAVPFVE